jgi:hypothetical protein
MTNIWDNLCELAKSVKYQNLFTASKEVYGIKLFRNSIDLSNIQSIFLSWLYNFDSINRDIILDKISPHVLDNQIYWDAYMIWKRKNMKKIMKDNKQSDVHLVAGKKINFPAKGK